MCSVSPQVRHPEVFSASSLWRRSAVSVQLGPCSWWQWKGHCMWVCQNHYDVVGTVQKATFVRVSQREEGACLRLPDFQFELKLNPGLDETVWPVCGFVCVFISDDSQIPRLPSETNAFHIAPVAPYLSSPFAHSSSPSLPSFHSSPPTIFPRVCSLFTPSHPQSVPSICSLLPSPTISCPLCVSPHSLPPPTSFQEATFYFWLVVCICHVRALAIS